MSATPQIDASAAAADAGGEARADGEARAESIACTNCGSPRTGYYCSTCGQKAMPLAPTLGYFVHELMHELVHVDGKIFRSMRLLLTRPGFLTRELFAGRRASYISPIRLYLIGSILAFAIAGAFGGFDAVDVNSTASPGQTDEAAQTARAALLEETMNTAFNVWLPRAMFVLVPLFAALVMLFRHGSGHTYPQHLYFALHVHAAWFFANAVDSLFEAPVSPRYAAPIADVVTELYIVGYFFVAFWRVYEATFWGALWRAASIGLLYLAALLLTLIAIAAPTAWPIFMGQPS